MMMVPQYVVLTVTRVAERNPRNPRHATGTILNPPVRQLFVLPLMISKSQHGPQCEIEHADGKLLTFAEHFEDVVNAINDAAMGGLAVAKPPRREEINAAATQPPARGLKALAEEMKAGTATFRSPSEAERRAAEGAKHQGEIAAAVEAAPDYDAAQDIATWGDFVQTDGENVGAPTKRKAQRGDLRIFNFADDRFWIEYADVSSTDDNEVEWLRGKVPDELKAVYANYETARLAVKLAGYIRRLIED